MVTSCVAYNCTNRQKKGSSISFHRFPDVKKMPEHRAAWIQAIRRKDWTPTSNSFLCSEHFEENCFVVRPNKIGRRLNDWAVPSIFNFPSHRQSKQKKFRKSKKQLAEATVGSSTVEGQDVPSHAKVTRRSAVEDQDVPSHVKVARRSAVEDQDVQSHTKVARSSIVEDEDVPSHAKVARLSVVEDQDVQSHAKVTQDSIMEDQDVPSHAKVARSNVIEVQDGSSHAKVAKQPDQEESRIARKHPAESSVGCSVVVDEGVPSLAKVAQRLCTEHSYVSQSQPVPPKIIKKTAELKKKIKALNQKLRRKQQRINRLTYLVKSIGDQRLLIEVNSDAFSDSTDGGEITTEKASEATETIVEVSTPMGCTQGHEFPDEDELPLPRSLPISAATNGIAIERTTADQYQPFSMPVQATVPPTVDDTELVNLRNEVHVLKKELVRCRDTVVKLNYHEKKLKDRLSEQAQKQFLRGPTKFEDISLGAVRPTELIRSFGNLYTEARVEAFDALDEVPQMAGFDDLKGKLLFSIVVLSFRSVQQEILVIKKKIRDLLHMPETFEDPEEASSDDSLGKMAKELETMMSDYFRRTVHKQDIQKNIEEVSQQMCQTLYDYPGLKDSDGLKLYTEEVVRLAWALSVQNPPLFIVYDFKTFNPEELTRFHSSDPESDEVKAVLWPALQEGMEGAIVHKAVVIT